MRTQPHRHSVAVSNGSGVAETDRMAKLKMGSSARGAAERSTERPRNQAGRPTAAELERRKIRVIEVATELFVEKGYADTSLVDIARNAGVATRTLYQHFGDKEALLREVIFARDTGAFFQRPIVDRNASVRDTLRQTAEYVIELTYRERSVNLMRLMIAESKRFPDLTRQVAVATFSRFRRSLANVFEGLAQRGLIAAGDHARSGAIFLDLILGSTPIMAYTAWEPAPPTAAELDQKVDLFIKGWLETAPT